MKAIIIPTGNQELFGPLKDWMPEYLFPIVNKPIVEHLIELLFRNNIKEIILSLKHMPYETERYFDNGSRWGCEISYSLEREYAGIISSLCHIQSRLNDSFLCLPWNMVTDMDISGLIKAHEERTYDITVPQLKNWDYAMDIKESYPFIMTPKALSLLSTSKAVVGIENIMALASEKGLNLNSYSSEFNLRTVHNINDYLEINRLVLHGGFRQIIIPGKQIEPGIWIGKRTRVHPDVKMVPPVLIGSFCNIRGNTIIGEDTIVGNNVIVDHGVSAKGSVILDDSYLGSHIEIKDTIIRKNSMFSVPRQLNIYMGDDFILGDLNKSVFAKNIERLFNLSGSLFLLFLFSPLIIFLYLYHIIFRDKKYLTAEERCGAYEVVDLQGNIQPRRFGLYFFRSRNRFIAKLPGLINVIKGDMNLVGNSPLSPEEADLLRDEWEKMRFKAPAGLFHLWEMEGGSDITWEEKIVAENYYASTRTLYGDLKILFKGFIL